MAWLQRRKHEILSKTMVNTAESTEAVEKAS